MKIPDFEIGAPICCNRNRCVLGKISKGSRTRVSVRIKCPEGTKPVGIWHTHPGGRAEPSEADILNLYNAGLDISCVTNEKETRCFRISELLK